MFLAIQFWYQLKPDSYLGNQTNNLKIMFNYPKRVFKLIDTNKNTNGYVMTEIMIILSYSWGI